MISRLFIYVRFYFFKNILLDDSRLKQTKTINYLNKLQFIKIITIKYIMNIFDILNFNLKLIFF